MYISHSSASASGDSSRFVDQQDERDDATAQIQELLLSRKKSGAAAGSKRKAFADLSYSGV